MKKCKIKIIYHNFKFKYKEVDGGEKLLEVLLHLGFSTK